MNKKKRNSIILGILVFVLALGTILTIILPQSIITTPSTPLNTPTVAPRNDLSNPDVTATSTQYNLSDQIVVNSPKAGQIVSSPLKITGKAVGPWYFEASFPVELVDLKTGLDIAKGLVQAVGGTWMTEDFVSFEATLQFDKPSTTTSAVLILRKDNPSGLPENDKSISIPVTVK